MKRLVAGMLSVSLIFSLAACTPKAEEPPAESVPATEAAKTGYTPGVYTGTARGMFSDITVEVTVNETSITDLKVVSCQDTDHLCSAAIAEMPGKIIAAQSLAVDTTAGASFSSRGILGAAKDALTQAGGDMTALTAALPKTEKAALPDESFDIVIVGAGGAGLSAAMWAGEISDCSVLVLEKCAMVGGSTALSGGGISIGSSKVTAEKGLPAYTGKELADFYEEHTASLDYLPEGTTINRNLVEKIGDQSGLVFDYLVDKGFPAFNTFGMHYFDQENNRGVTGAIAANGAAGTYADWFSELAVKNGAEIRANSKVVELVTDNGAVTGVKVETPDSTYTVHAKKVILATGGFANNLQMVREHNSDWDSINSVWSFTAAGGTGDAITLTEPLNADFTGYGMLCDVASTPPYGTCLPMTNEIINTLLCYVNNQGELFTDSGEVQYRRAYDILNEEKAQAWTIASIGTSMIGMGGSARLTAEEYAKEMMDLGLCVQADTLEELAEATGMGPEKLKASVAAFNEEARAGKMAFYYYPVNPVEEGGPYYAFRLTSSILATLSGIKLNDDFQVVNTAGEAIPNLYAAGECAMGNYLVGQYPCGTQSITCAVYGGTLAAEEAVAAITENK